MFEVFSSTVLLMKGNQGVFTDSKNILIVEYLTVVHMSNQQILFFSNFKIYAESGTSQNSIATALVWAPPTPRVLVI